MLHAAAAAGKRLDTFVVRKDAKAHGLQRRIEGSPVEGRKVLAVEDTSTTGGSVLTAVEALREAGAEVVGVAVVVDRDTGAREAIEAAGLHYRFAVVGPRSRTRLSRRPAPITLEAPRASTTRSIQAKEI